MIRVHLANSDTHLESHGRVEYVELGPFPWVTLTYNSLLVGPDGDEIGAFKNGCWHVTIEGRTEYFSDITLEAKWVLL